MANSYKTLKEDFVSNLPGGSIEEVHLVVLVCPVQASALFMPRPQLTPTQAAALFWSVLQARRGFFLEYGPEAVIADFLLNVCGILFAMTLYSSSPLLLLGLLVVPAILLFVLAPSGVVKEERPPHANGPAGLGPKGQRFNHLPLRPFVTTYRGALMIITCMAILAVDFPVFPRRFAKVETWGTSLMDMGVGSFVFSAGVVAAKQVLRDEHSGRKTGLGRRLYVSTRHAFPILALGLVRLFMVKGVDYAEHVTEYGVHWNFFFTLAFLPPFVAIFQSLFALIPSYAMLALLLAIAYQVALESTGLQEFILIAPRSNLFSQNREGIFSFFGYLSIFLAGQSTGRYLLPQQSTRSAPPEHSRAQRKHLLLQLASWSVVWGALLFFTTSYEHGLGMQVSRRLANLPYVLWVCFFNCSMIAITCLFETMVFPDAHRAVAPMLEQKRYRRHTSRILDAYNRNGLAIFLLANLLTGLINLTFDTIHMSAYPAMGVLVGYAIILTAVALTLDIRNITIKL
jgi:glucosaminylphosphatidylinositol acyltransferase